VAIRRSFDDFGPHPLGEQSSWTLLGQAERYHGVRDRTSRLIGDPDGESAIIAGAGGVHISFAFNHTDVKQGLGLKRGGKRRESCKY
jgi:hypothetical protein